jgi:hypothetical protein
MPRNCLRRRTLVLAAVVALLPALFGVGPVAAGGKRPSPSANPILVENSLPGTTAWKLSSPALKDQISGYPSRESVRPGQQISFSVRTLEPWFGASIYRMGWYGGAGARLMASFPWLPGHAWTVPKPNRRTGLLVCNWPASFGIAVPAGWVSGIYLVKLTDSMGYQSYIPFTVLESGTTSPLLMIDTITTSEAYNWWGGKSLYVDIKERGATAQFAHRAVMVSFDRPFVQNAGAGWFLSWEIHMVRWLEKNGYDVGYANDLDLNDDHSILLNRKGIIITGHDEYWSAAMRNAMDAAVTSGVSLANFAANTGYWQIRFAALGSNPDGIEVCYKDFHRDPVHTRHPRQATVEWRSKWINRPESELLGAMYQDFEGTHGPFAWVAKNPHGWVFARSGLHRGSRVDGMVGHEEDAVLAGYPHPKGLHVLSASAVIDSIGHHRVSNSTFYQARSGAVVFDGSTIDWSYGLDDVRQDFWNYPPARRAPSTAIERITANVLNRALGSP